jgi:membrane-associated phospholipid phosphatase
VQLFFPHEDGMRFTILVIVAWAVPASLPAQSPALTTIPDAPRKVGASPARTALLIGGVIFAAGLLDDKVQSFVQDERNATSNSVARVGNTFGTGTIVFPALLSAWVAGAALGGDGVQKAAGHALIAATTGGLAAVAIKHTMGRMRPSSGFDSDHFDWFEKSDASFPSGHTAVAFSVASSLSRDIRGHWDDVALFGAASLTGFARLNDNKHWFSDVLGGAAVGILAGRWATRGHRSVTAGPSGVSVRLEF